MKGYVTKTPEAKALRRVVKKYGTLNIKDDNIEGAIQITHYRQYDFQEEVDVTFTGKMNVSIGWGKEWVAFEKYSEIAHRISHVRLNRIVRHTLYWEVKSFLLIFDIRLKSVSEIKKIKWVG
jgi:hypothetical protein